MSARAALGCRAKTGRAICVALAMDDETPRFVWRGEIALVDPGEVEGPYHQVMELPWERAVVDVLPLVERIEVIAKDALTEVIEAHGVRAVGVVGSADRPIAKLGNPHVRAHAAEGILFRRVIELAAERLGLSWRGYTEKELTAAATSLGAGTSSHLKALGKDAGSPWRSDEKAAATAAWLALKERGQD